MLIILRFLTFLFGIFWFLLGNLKLKFIGKY